MPTEDPVVQAHRDQRKNTKANYWPLVNSERAIAQTKIHPKTQTVFLFSQEAGLPIAQAVQEVNVENAARHIVESRVGLNEAEFRYANEEEIDIWFADQARRVAYDNGAQRAGQNRSIVASPDAVVARLREGA